MKFYFVRHGESEANVASIFSNRGFIHGLTPNGRDQVKTRGEKLKDIQIDKLIASPLKRAVQTAEILSEFVRQPIHIDAALSEVDMGILEGEPIEKNLSHFFELLEDWLVKDEPEKRVPEGESLLDVQNRFYPLMEELRSTCDDQSTIMLVGHGTMYCCVLPFILQNIDGDFSRNHFLKNAECVLAEQRGDDLFCVSWGNVDFA